MGILALAIALALDLALAKYAKKNTNVLFELFSNKRQALNSLLDNTLHMRMLVMSLHNQVNEMSLITPIIANVDLA